MKPSPYCVIFAMIYFRKRLLCDFPKMYLIIPELLLNDKYVSSISGNASNQLPLFVRFCQAIYIEGS